MTSQLDRDIAEALNWEFCNDVLRENIDSKIVVVHPIFQANEIDDFTPSTNKAQAFKLLEKLSKDNEVMINRNIVSIPNDNGIIDHYEFEKLEISICNAFISLAKKESEDE